MIVPPPLMACCLAFQAGLSGLGFLSVYLDAHP